YNCKRPGSQYLRQHIGAMRSGRWLRRDRISSRRPSSCGTNCMFPYREHRTDEAILSKRTTAAVRPQQQKLEETCNRLVPAGLATYDMLRKIPAFSKGPASEPACVPEHPQGSLHQLDR